MRMGVGVGVGVGLEDARDRTGDTGGGRAAELNGMLSESCQQLQVHSWD